MFCKTCTTVATEKCGEHELLKISELRDALRQLAQKGAADMDTVKRRRAEAVALFREAHTVLVSVAESLRHTIDDYEMDVQLDDNIVSELERKRESAEALPSDQLVDSYRFTEQHVADAGAALHETQTLAEQCRALLAASVSLSADQNGLGQTFTVGEWLKSGDLMQALLAASVVVYSLDHVTSEEEEAAARDDDCRKGGDASGAAATPTGTAGNAPSAGPLTNGNVENSNHKPSSKSLPSGNGKTGEKSSKSGGASVTKAPVTAPAAKGSSLSSATNGVATAKASDSGKSAKAAPAKEKSAANAAASKTAQTAKATTQSNNLAATAKQSNTSAKQAIPAATSKTGGAAPASAKAPSFSSMVKSTSATASVTDPGGAWTTVKRSPPRGVHPMYSLRMTDGTRITDVIVELRTDMAPIMCRNFMMLCDEGYLDNTSKSGYQQFTNPHFCTFISICNVVIVRSLFKWTHLT